MTSCKQLEIQLEDPSPEKWCYPLKEDDFAALMSKENQTVHKVFGAGSLFSPSLFGKFFDPSDAFPLWEFEADAFHYNSHSSSKRKADWFQTDTDYVLKAELLGLDSNTLQVCVQNGKVLEISDQWRQQRESRKKDWKISHWWEYGYVRRLELPEQTDWKRSEACMKNDVFLEIKIPKIHPNSGSGPQEN